MAKLTAPSGLAIARNGKRFTFSWKLGKKHSDQTLEYRTFNGSRWTGWTTLADNKVGKNTTSVTVAIELTTHFTKLEFRVRGDKGKKHTAWASYAHDIGLPAMPSGAVELNSEFRSSFTWSIAADDTNWYPCTGYTWQTILQKDYNTSDGSKASWNKVASYDKGSWAAWSGSLAREEQGWSDANYSYTRWVRVCANGPAGSSAWRYLYHTYARPQQTSNVKASLDHKKTGGYNISASWTANGNFSKPIDKTVVEYSIVEPATSASTVGDKRVTTISCPNGASWTAVNDLGDRTGNRGISFPVSQNIAPNMAMFVRVNSVHDSATVEGVPTLVSGSLQSLSDPTGLQVTAADPSTRRFTVSANNTSNLTASFIEILYRTSSNPAASQIVGIIPPGASSVTCQLPVWPSGDSVSLGARACVGDYSPATPVSGVNDYKVTPKMRSNLVWDGGAVPLPPGNVQATQLASDKVQVTWEWLWAEATGAELSWSDHEDAWESTNTPSTYTITNVHASKWIISGLDIGTWYVRLRLFKETGDTTTFGTYSEIIPVKLSASPDTPHLVVSESVVPESGTIECYWAYVSNDGTGQLQADITEAFIDGDNITYLDPPVASTNAAQHLSLNVSDLGWKAGDPPHYLVVRVTSISGESSVGWSKPVAITVADKITAEIVETSLVTGDFPIDPTIEDQTITGDIVTVDNSDDILVVRKLDVPIEPIQDLHGYDKPWVGGAGKNKCYITDFTANINGLNVVASGNVLTFSGSNTSAIAASNANWKNIKFEVKTEGRYYASFSPALPSGCGHYVYDTNGNTVPLYQNLPVGSYTIGLYIPANISGLSKLQVQLEAGTSATDFAPYENICPISGHTECVTSVTGKNLFDRTIHINSGYRDDNGVVQSASGSSYTDAIKVNPSTMYTASGNYATSSYSARVYFLTAKGEWISRTNSIYVSQFPYTFTTPSNCGYIQIQIATASTLTNCQIEAGSTATDYEPYNGNTYTTEFDGYYTKTSEDTMPYTKRIAELDGDRLREKIVGGTIAWNQLVQNGNFDGATGWSSAGYGTITVANNIGTLTISDSSGSARIERIFTPIVGHKYLAYMDFKPSFDGNPFMSFQAGSYASQIGRTSVLAGNWVRCIGIRNVVSDDTTSGKIRYYFGTTNVSVGDTVQFRNAGLFDLTQMFGATIADYIYSLEQANAGDGVAYFKSLFPNDYYEYNTGELKSVENVSAHRTGKNFLPNIKYQEAYTRVQVGSTGDYSIVLPAGTYKYSGSAVSGATPYWRKQGGTPNNFNNNMVLTETTRVNIWYYKNGGISVSDIDWFQLELGTTATGYEPYAANSYPLDSSLTLRGIPKLDSSNQLYYDGDTYEANGTVTRKYGIVDLGTLNWFYGNNYFRTSGINDLIKRASSQTTIPNVICHRYLTQPWNSSDDKSILINTSNSGQAILIKDSAYTDEASFKTAMSGVMLVYELATPTTESAEPFTEIQKVVSGGLEEYVTDSIVPVGHQTEYLTRAIFGGTLDVVSGVLTVDRAIITIDENSDIRFQSDKGTYLQFLYVGTTQIVGGTLGMAKCKCNAFEPKNADMLGTIRVRNSSSTKDVFLNVSTEYDTVDKLKAWLTNNHVQLVAQLVTPQVVQLTPYEVELLVGGNNIWTDIGEISATVGSRLAPGTLLTTLPMTVTATGAGVGGITRYIIERSGAYHLDRPDETDYQGYDRETIAIKTMPETDDQTAESQVSFDLGDLIGRLDDGARYRLIAEAIDSYGQSAVADPIEFKVNWGHPAVDPTALVEPDMENLVTYITPLMPESGYEEGDTCDIYRLSADLPELIYANAKFGTKYVDPYPTLGRFGGHRVVYKTRYDDYITADYGVGWEDYTAEDPEYAMDLFGIVIDFDGEQLILPYDVTVSNSWEKDFIETKYLGGAVQGDWNPGISKTASLSTNIPVEYNPENIELVRQLAMYPGACHVRTPDGSSYTANVTVKEDREERMINKLARISLDITRIDPVQPDGMTYEDWIKDE